MTTFAGWRMLPVQTTYGGFYYSVAADALTFGTLWAAYELISRRFSLQNLGAGALAVWTVMMLATSIAMPGGSYIFTLAAAIRDARDELSLTRHRHPTIRLAILALVALAPGIVMLAPSFAAISDGTMLFLVLGGLTARTAFRLVHPVHRFPYRRTPMDRARRAWIARDRHDHQRQRRQ